MRRIFVGPVVFTLLAASWHLLPRGTELDQDSMLVGGQAVAQQSRYREAQQQTPAVQRFVQQVAPEGTRPASVRDGRAASLTVRVKGLIPKGDVLVAVFEKSSEFPNRDKATHTESLPAKGKQAHVRFENLPPGEYAVAIFQDLNSDGLLNKSTFGAPTEPYGFSNNARGNFGPPSFQAAAFTLASGGKNVEVTVH